MIKGKIEDIEIGGTKKAAVDEIAQDEEGKMGVSPIEMNGARDNDVEMDIDNQY